MRRVLTIVTFLPAAATALPWDGTYRAPGGACGAAAGGLRIAEGRLEAEGGACAMTEPVDVLDMEATLYRMECEGGGEAWEARAMLMRAAEGDGLFLIWDGRAYRYERCAAERPPGGAAPG